MKYPVRVLAISGSLRPGSAHIAILEHLQSVFTHHTVIIYNELEAIPNFNPATDTDSPPVAVQHFRSQLAAADAVLFCTPEYAYGIPGALKNALDWTVSSGSFVDKPVAFITASGLGEHAHASLLLVLTALNAKITGSLLIPYFRSKMNKDNQITDADTHKSIQELFKDLLSSTPTA